MVKNYIIEDETNKELKQKVKQELNDLGINHTTIEFEKVNEVCCEEECDINIDSKNTLHHHH